MYPNLMAELGRSGMTRTQLSKASGIPSKSLYHKLSGKGQFTLMEMLRIRVAIPTAREETLDYVFTLPEGGAEERRTRI